jgi:hypothetical protein
MHQDTTAPGWLPSRRGLGRAHGRSGGASAPKPCSTVVGAGGPRPALVAVVPSGARGRPAGEGPCGPPTMTAPGGAVASR